LNRWGKVIQGYAALRQWLDRRPRDVTTCHVCSNIVVERISSNEAWGTTYFTFYSATHRGARWGNTERRANL